MFQWSFGAYIHPDFLEDTRWAFENYDLHKNHLIQNLAQIFEIPPQLASLTASFGRSWTIANAKVNIYKHYNTVLTSVEKFFPGYLGYQQWPWVATVDTLAAWTQSGEVIEDWEKRANDKDVRENANTHLPYVKQIDNVALIMYNPNANLQLIATKDLGDELGRDTFKSFRCLSLLARR